MVPLFEQNDAFFRSYMTSPNMVFNYKLFHLNRPSCWLPFFTSSWSISLKKRLFCFFVFRVKAIHGTLFQNPYYSESAYAMCKQKDQVHERVIRFRRKVFGEKMFCTVNVNVVRLVICEKISCTHWHWMYIKALTAGASSCGFHFGECHASATRNSIK